MSNLRQWLQARHTKNPLPLLFDEVDAAVSESPFHRLPTEIRLHILRLAFGDRTLHLEINDSNLLAHNITTYPHIPPEDQQWATCVYQRCMQTHIHKSSWECLTESIIGVSGWMRSCRLGSVLHLYLSLRHVLNNCRYIEATHVLYSTNTFRIDCMDLMENIDVVLPMRRAAGIRTLDLTAKFSLRDIEGSGAPGIGKLETLLWNLRDYFPSLRRLDLFMVWIVSRLPLEEFDEEVVDFVDRGIGLVGGILSCKDVRIEITIPGRFLVLLQERIVGGITQNYTPIGNGKYWRKGTGEIGLVISQGNPSLDI